MQTDPYTGPVPVAEYAAEAELERSSWRNHRTRLLILGGVIALAVAYMVYAAFPGNTLYFVTVSEFMEDPRLRDGQTLRVAGALAPDSFRREDGSTLSYFSLGDKQADVPGIAPGSPQVEATYVGVLPDLFFNPHSEIILEGHYDGHGEVFATDNILVKCPSKYQSMQSENPDLIPGAAAPAQSY
ncbi:MAG: cytochrome c maturation protein CcmE [Chloroflexi bacterium]|nr:cytochrome c maturation protein CcmE [Chloroflexota bacterium]